MKLGYVLWWQGACTVHLILYHWTEVFPSVINKDSRWNFQFSSSNSKRPRNLTSRTLRNRKQNQNIGVEQQCSGNEVDTLSNSRPWPTLWLLVGVIDKMLAKVNSFEPSEFRICSIKYYVYIEQYWGGGAWEIGWRWSKGTNFQL